jgi:peptidoglycan/xylan/chitin deacetylase (PgdA/CDA1 family)
MKVTTKVQHRSRTNPSRLLKFVVSSLVFGCDALRELFLKLTGRRPKGACVVLYYHSIPAEQRALFADQLDTALRMARAIDVTQEVALPSGERMVGITFDDAFENFVSEALPELQKRKVPATMFVISGALGKAFGPAATPERVMTVAQLRELPSDLISLGSHTLTHPYMPEVGEATAFRELRESKTTLERILGREISTFSFPFGGFTPRLIDMAKEAGYRRVFTTLPQFAFSTGPHELVVGRVRVDPTDWPMEFRLKVRGAYRWLPSAISWKRRLTIFRRSSEKDPNEVRTRSAIQELGAS